MTYDAIVIGVSAGGLKALSTILPELKKNLPVAVLVVQHLSPNSDDFLVEHLDSICQMTVCEAEDKAPLDKGTIYIAPPGYHLLLEDKRTLALSMEERVNYSRPSIDVLFETAAEAFLEKLIGVVLTGANIDGSEGLVRIHDLGGLTVVQDPKTAQVDIMPLAALSVVKADHVVSLEKIGSLLNQLVIG